MADQLDIWGSDKGERGSLADSFGFAPSIFAPPNIVELFERIGSAKDAQAG